MAIDAFSSLYSCTNHYCCCYHACISLAISTHMKLFPATVTTLVLHKRCIFATLRLHYICRSAFFSSQVMEDRRAQYPSKNLLNRFMQSACICTYMCIRMCMCMCSFTPLCPLVIQWSDGNIRTRLNLKTRPYGFWHVPCLPGARNPCNPTSPESINSLPFSLIGLNQARLKIHSKSHHLRGERSSVV